MNMEHVLNIAREAALKAGQYLRDAHGKGTQIEYKGDIDLVTVHDTGSQEIIFDIIRKHFPEHSILGEENLNEEKDKEFQWLIDPIDGTTNFAHSLPAFCVSIAFAFKGEITVGVVYLPVLDELFHAVKGQGAFLNDHPIRVSAQEDLNIALLATGFPYDRKVSPVNNVNHFNRFIVKCLGIRRMGSAAIDLCYTAAGRFDGFWELKLNPWDTAAAFLMVQEAGGIVTDFSGKPFSPYMKECLAANPHLHRDMMEILKNS